MNYRVIGAFLLVAAFLAACTSSALPEATPVSSTGEIPTVALDTAPPPTQPSSMQSESTPLTPQAGFTATSTAMPTASLTPLSPTPSATLRATLAPDEWQTLPIIPTLSARALEVYQHGQELGNNPEAFSKLGDCESSTSWFLNDFDLGPKYYNLGEHTQLEAIVEQYQGSFSRRSLASKPGFNAASLLSPLWSDRKQCEPGETPLACEYRLHRPAFAFLVLGSNDAYHLDVFEGHMRTIIEFSLAAGVVPILTTKADNLEGDHFINATIARLSWEYELPLWNFWLAVQPLPYQGLQDDGVHLTWSPNFFNDTHYMQRAWPVRNLNALQVLYSLQAEINANQGEK